MVTLSKIYTRSGDKGETGLGDGSRRPKHDPRVAVTGTVDEANAAIGIARVHVSGPVDGLLAGIQNDLFDLGADLCVPEPPPGDGPAQHAGRLRMTASQVTALEQAIDLYNAPLETLRSFILPGGSPAAAFLHLARTVTRRAEREATALAAQEAVNPEALKYLNRLSDLLFVLGRHCHDGGRADLLWVPGANRG